MFERFRARAVAIAAVLALLLPAAPVFAGAGDYRFELVSAQPTGSGKTAVTIRLVHALDNKPVSDAVLFKTTADMALAGMADMAGKVSVLPGDQPGLYRLQVETGMAGRWQLTLDAKVQGESGTVRGTVPFEAR